MSRLALATATKLGVAKALFKATTALRFLAGKRGTRVITRRHGLVWDLDLSEGIDFSIYLLGHYEKNTARALARLASPGMVVLDIGANIGAHALPLARAVGPGGKVLAIEPTDFAFSKLRANVALNPELSSILEPIQATLAGPELQAPDAFFSSWSLAHQAAAAHPVHHGALRKAGDARILTLDQLVAEQGLATIDLIKLDVDGFETDVLSGAQATLEAHRPPIVMELCEYVQVDRGKSLDELVGMLSALGYRFWQESSGKELPRTATGLRALIPEGGSINIVAASDDSCAVKLRGSR